MNSSTQNTPDYEKTWAIITHLIMIPLFFLPFINIIIPFILKLVHRNGTPFINRHTSAALSLGVTLTLGAFFFTLTGFFVMSGFSDDVVAKLMSQTKMHVNYAIFFTPIVHNIIQKIFLGTAVIFPTLWFLGTIKGAMNANRGKTFHYPFTFFLFKNLY